MNNVASPLPQGYVLRGPERDYTIISVLGRGGFGITYLAAANVRVGSINIEARFAIKEHFRSDVCSRSASTHAVEFSQPVAEDVERSLRAFIKEAGRIKGLGIDSPNMVCINEVFETNNTAYYVMEYLGDFTLEKVVRQQGPLSPEQLGLYLRPVAEAVAQLHSRRMAHYDIKPQNIMMAPVSTGDVRPVLIDFGLAKHYTEQGHATSTTGAMGFSPGYSAAEQYGGIREFSPAMDTYSLGATAYFCLTGKTPPEAFSVKADDIRAELIPICGTAMASAIAHAIALTPDTRTPDASAFVNEMWGGATVPTPAPVTTPASTAKETIHVPAPPTEVVKEKKLTSHPAGTENTFFPGIPNILGMVVMLVLIGLDIYHLSRWSFPVVYLLITLGMIIGTCFYLVLQLIRQSSRRKLSLAVFIGILVSGAVLYVTESTIAPDKRVVFRAMADAVQEEEVIDGVILRPFALNLDLCVLNINSRKYYYLDTEGWNALTESSKAQFIKIGIVIIGNDEQFVLKFNESEASMNWQDAMAKYGNQLPSLEQAVAISRQQGAIQENAKAYGWENWKKPGFWTRTEYNVNQAWELTLYRWQLPHSTLQTIYIDKKALSHIILVRKLPM